MPIIPKARLVSQVADLQVENPGVSFTEKHSRAIELESTYTCIPDILRLIANETLLKHSTIIRILEESGREEDFMNNPQAFYERVLEIIARNRHELAIDGIKYVKLAGQEYYAQEIFDSQEFIAYLDRNAISVEHSIYMII